MQKLLQAMKSSVSRKEYSMNLDILLFLSHVSHSQFSYQDLAYDIAHF